MKKDAFNVGNVNYSAKLSVSLFLIAKLLQLNHCLGWLLIYCQTLFSGYV